MARGVGSYLPLGPSAQLPLPPGHPGMTRVVGGGGAVVGGSVTTEVGGGTVVTTVGGGGSVGVYPSSP